MSGTKVLTFCLGFLIGLLSIESYAQTYATRCEVEQVAQHYTHHFLNHTDATPTIINIYTYHRDEQPLLYDVQMSNGCALIVSPVKSCSPILAYYTQTEVTPLLQAYSESETYNHFIEKYCYEIGYAIDSLDAVAEHPLWAFYLQNSFIKPELTLYEEREAVGTVSASGIRGDSTQFGPYITTKWGQTLSNDGKDHNAYNHFVTETCKRCNGGKCPVGCVALAMAQIMRFWQHPAAPASRNYQYDWTMMPNQLLTSSEHYQEERNQIAQLLVDCGKSAKVNYCYMNTCQSFTWPENAREALVKEFDYAKDATRKLRSSYTTKRWKSLLINDLMAGRPILYAAISFNTKKYRQGGHAFICDGYNSQTDFFHFNWGKKGKHYDVWYNIDELICDGKNWNHLERAIVGIRPNNQ